MAFRYSKGRGIGPLFSVRNLGFCRETVAVGRNFIVKKEMS